MRRAALAGVETIEHGDEGDVEVFRLMAKQNVGYCPTLAAAEGYARYFGGWQPGRVEPKSLMLQGEPASRPRSKRVSPSSTAATSAFSRTATAHVRSRCWSNTA